MENSQFYGSSTLAQCLSNPSPFLPSVNSSNSMQSGNYPQCVPIPANENQCGSLKSPLLTPIFMTDKTVNLDSVWDNLDAGESVFTDSVTTDVAHKAEADFTVDLSLAISPSSSNTTDGYLSTILDDFASLDEVSGLSNQLPDISKIIPNPGYLQEIPTRPRSGSETESTSPGSPQARTSYSCVLEVITAPKCSPNVQEDDNEEYMGVQKSEPASSSDERTYAERENRRKERNNAASRKSRALRKRKFQQMLTEAERLASSNAKLRQFLEELNSVMAEAQAILIERVGNSATVTAETEGLTSAQDSGKGDSSCVSASSPRQE